MSSASPSCPSPLPRRHNNDALSSMHLCRVLVLLVLFCVLVLLSTIHEGFLEASCADYTNCVSCANKSDCTWCSSNNRCLTKSQINGDAICSPINLIHEAPMCTVERSGVVNRPDNGGENQVADVVKPPNVFMTDVQEYSPETVMAQVLQLRKEMQNHPPML